MNSRRYSRSMREAFPFGAEYGCAIERPSRGHRVANWTVAAGFVYLLALAVWEWLA